jgi:hypothetical protein
MTQIAYSWSRLSDFEKCPLLCYWKNFAPKGQRIPFTDNEATLRGKKAHKDLELAVGGKPVPYELRSVEPVVAGIQLQAKNDWNVRVEQQIAFTRGYTQCSWFAADAYLRVIYDVILTHGDKASIIDWKTGKVRESSDQLKLFGMSAMLLHPQVDYVGTHYVWVDHKTKTTASYNRGELPALIEEFEERAEMIQIASDSNSWQANPSDFNCRWCPCNKAQCKYARGV